ncbi:MAG: hypothetical protein JWP36_2614 [Paucimonas sp.]|nr:hypothetical protein [Paucimonas sp.]
MKKLFLFAISGFVAASAWAASDDKSSARKSSDKDTAALVKDEKADNAADKKAVKKATPAAKQGAKEEADKVKADAGARK